jgi:adenylate cyclase
VTITRVSVDFEAEGLLEGLGGEEREARLRLLTELEAGGVTLDELRTAVDEGRLVLLPVERVLEGEGRRYSLNEVAERTGVPAEYLARQRQAIGLSVEDPDDEVVTDGDLAAAERIRILLDAGLPEEGLLEVSRVIGIAMSQLAAANRALIADSMVRDGDTEYDLAMRLAAAAKSLQPLVGETLEHALRLHVREQVRHDVLGGLAAAADGQGVEVSACFADLVDYTRLGERLPVDALGAVTGRLNEMAASVATGPVRLVKLIGDGAMLVSADNDALLAAAIEIVELAEAEAGDDFPQLRAGAARGRAVTRGGDWYGPPINTASRISGVAYPGSILVDEAAKEEAGESFRFSFAGERRLKGLSGGTKLFRLRPADGDG